MCCLAPVRRKSKRIYIRPYRDNNIQQKKDKEKTGRVGHGRHGGATAGRPGGTDLLERCS